MLKYPDETLLVSLDGRTTLGKSNAPPGNLGARSYYMKAAAVGCGGCKNIEEISNYLCNLAALAG